MFGHIKARFLAAMLLAAAVSGVHGETKMTDEQMIAAGIIPGTSTQWPSWRGPYGNHQAVDCKDELITDITQARVAWVSEQHFPGPIDCHQDPNFMGSPVVAEDRVYVWYYQPTDELYDIKSSRWNKKDNDPKNPRNNLRALAEDHLMAMDFKTGKTIWDVVMPLKGVNWVNLNYAARMQICYGDGRIYAIGSSGACYAIDAKTGKIVWQADFGKEVLDRFDTIVKKVRDGATSMYSAIGTLKYWGSKVGGYIDGVVTFWPSDGLYAFDAATGQLLWKKDVSGGVGVQAMPFQRPDHPPVFLYTSRNTLTAFEARTGRELWSVDSGEHAFGAKLTRYGDYILTNAEGLGISAYKVTDGGCKYLWSNPAVGLGRHMVPSIHKDHVFVHGHAGDYKMNEELLEGKRTRCLNLETGELVKAFNAGYRWNDWHAILSNGKQYYFGGVMAADPVDYRQLDFKGTDAQECGRLPRFEPDSHPPISYMCPLIVDGYLIAHCGYRVVCWDLRATPEAAKEEAK